MKSNENNIKVGFQVGGLSKKSTQNSRKNCILWLRGALCSSILLINSHLLLRFHLYEFNLNYPKNPK